ncbi:MAG: glycosyltransferase family 2 protein [Bacilli bacterium]|nr:glycosyltransferase family 2 protein [Bacilli bacterium]
MIYNSIGLIFIISAFILLIYSYLVMPRCYLKPKKYNNKKRYCILIPARYESKVINNLLLSITKQTTKINPKDIYIIVESIKDKTVDIAKQYNMNIILRENLSLKRKGYALNDAVTYILKKQIHYDAYFIFDADNILDKDFIKNMEKSINEGYDIGIGYRNTKNSNTLVSASSALTFSMINTMLNERKNKYHNNLTISGTGYYIKGSIVEDWNSFPFHSLTEDYELTLYAILHNLTTTYNKKAIFYDEQPDNFNVSLKQRTRWVKGYFEVRKKYINKISKSETKNDPNFASKVNAFLGVTPYIYIIIGLLIILFNILITKGITTFLCYLTIFLLLIYTVLVLFTIIMLKKEKNSLNISKSMKIKVIFYNPIFMFSYIICLLRTIFIKDIKWDKIDHNKN